MVQFNQLVLGLLLATSVSAQDESFQHVRRMKAKKAKKAKKGAKAEKAKASKAASMAVEVSAGAKLLSSIDPALMGVSIRIDICLIFSSYPIYNNILVFLLYFSAPQQCQRCFSND